MACGREKLDFVPSLRELLCQHRHRKYQQHALLQLTLILGLSKRSSSQRSFSLSLPLTHSLSHYLQLTELPLLSSFKNSGVRMNFGTWSVASSLKIWSWMRS